MAWSGLGNGNGVRVRVREVASNMALGQGGFLNAGYTYTLTPWGNTEHSISITCMFFRWGGGCRGAEAEAHQPGEENMPAEC